MSTRARTLSLLSSCLLIALAGPVIADVIVVATDGSGDTTSVITAVDLALPGDTVLVRSGNYLPLGPFETEFIDLDKAIDIVGDEGATVLVPAIHVHDVPAGGPDILLRNLIVEDPSVPALAFEGATLHVEQVGATVIVEDCELRGVDGQLGDDLQEPPASGYAGLRITNSFNVVATRCQIEGGMGYTPFSPFEPSGSPGGPGVQVDNGRLTVYHGTVTGGAGGNAFSLRPAHPGGPGVVATDGTLVLMGGVITGGTGGSGCPPEAPEDCQGGDGLVAGSGSFVRTVGSEIAGGAGGVLTDASPGPSGTDVNEAGGTAVAFADAVAELSGPVALRTDEAGVITFAGTPGLLARLYFALDLLYVPLGGKKGTYLPSGPKIGPLLLGAIPPSGEIELPLVGPSLLGLPTVRATFQGYTTTGSGLILTNPLELVLLDATF